MICGLKQIKYIGKIPEETCACDVCENITHLLQGLRSALPNQDNDILQSPTALLRGIVCSTESASCIDGICEKCPGDFATCNLFNNVCNAKEVVFLKWVQGDKYPQKKEHSMTGQEAQMELQRQLNRYKRHYYNFLRQHKELKTLKSSLNENEIILQSDFSENYTNIQQNAIQSCYFGCESFALYTACAWHTKGAELVCDNFVIVSDQLDHSKHLVLKANMLLLNLLQERVPELKAIHFWSDGCGKQFKSKYCFYLLTKYPANIKVKWNYFESHHGKGPVDGVGGHVKLSVYRDVKAGKVVIKDAKHFAEYAHGTIKNINLIYLDKEDIPVVSVKDSLHVIGTLQIHSVEREVNDTEIHLKFYKNSQYDDVHDLPFRSIIYNHEANDPQPSNPEKSLDEKQVPCHEVTPIQQELLSKVSDVSSLSPSCNLAVLYEGDWWLGQVKEVSVENDDVHISFLHPKGPNNTFFWPSPEDNCWIPVNDILGQLVHPVLPISSRKVGIANDIVDIINDQFRVRFQ